MKSLLLAIATVTGIVCAQDIVPDTGPRGTVRLFTTDSAVLDSNEPRTDFACIVAPIPPELRFDLRFHAGYAVSIPATELEEGVSRLTVVLRVFPKKPAQEPVYFIQKLRIPEVRAQVDSRIRFEGAFRVGEGEYHVDWLMRDQNERFCARSWEFHAKINPKDRIPPGSVAQNRIEAEDPTLFADESPTPGEREGSGWRVKVLVNFAPQNTESVSLGSSDLDGLFGILRKISGESRIAEFSTIAISIPSQQEIYHGDGPSIDVPAIGRALGTLNLGTVDLERLKKNSGTAFLERVLTEELGTDPVDAIIFVGPKYYLDANVSSASLSGIGEVGAPVFYLNYNAYPVSKPWRDAVGHIVRTLQGREYTITEPQDLCAAWADIISRMLARRPVSKNPMEHQQLPAYPEPDTSAPTVSK